MKKAILILLVMSLCIGILAGCSNKEPDAPKSPETTKAPETQKSILGTWEYKGMDCAYVFNADGTGAYRYYGADMPFTYTDDGSTVSVLFTGNTAPNVLKYTIKGKTLSIEDSFGSIVEYEKTKDADPTQTVAPSVQTQPTSAPTSAEKPSVQTQATFAPTEEEISYDWWENSWYGWWGIKNGTGNYKEPSDLNLVWDAFAEINVNNNNTGGFTLWDTGTSKKDPLIYAYDITFGPGSGEHGSMVSKRVVFFPDGSWNNGMKADTMDERTIGWTVDPANSTVSHFENMLEITGHYASPENSEDSFDYYIYLRPWGTKWDDVRNGNTEGCLYKDMMPLYYDNWYISLLNLGHDKPVSTFQEGIDIINDYLANQNNQGGGALDPADKEGADGKVDMKTLKTALQWCKDNANYKTTYDEIAAQFGAHGQQKDSLFENNTIYRWWATEEAYVQITFSLGADGAETWNVTQYDGIS